MKSSVSRSLSAAKRPTATRRKRVAVAHEVAASFASARADEVLALNWIDRWVRLTPATLVDACDQAGIRLTLEAAAELSSAERTEAMRYADACVIAEGPPPRFLPPRMHSIEGGAARSQADIDRYPFALDAAGEPTAFYATRDGAIADGELRRRFKGWMVFDRRTGEVVWEADADAAEPQGDVLDLDHALDPQTIAAGALTVEALRRALSEADRRWTDSADCADSDDEYWAWIAKEALKVLCVRGQGGQGTSEDPLPPWFDFTDLDGEDLGSAMLLGLAGPPNVNGVTPLEAIARGCAEEAQGYAYALTKVDAAAPFAPLIEQHSHRLHGLAAMLRKVG